MVTVPPTRSLTAKARRPVHSVGDAFPQIVFLADTEAAGFFHGAALTSFAEAFPPTILGFKEGIGILIQQSRVTSTQPEIGHSQ
jgi:hypothetical protein